jgi:hypothetical protein
VMAARIFLKITGQNNPTNFIFPLLLEAVP